jgi:hypothetical protein
VKHQEFIEYLTYPKTLGDSSLTSINKVVDKFPYFQTAHMLLAKNLYNQNNIHYNEQLKIAAIYATDRTALYNLIYDNFNAPKFTSASLTINENKAFSSNETPKNEEKKTTEKQAENKREEKSLLLNQKVEYTSSTPAEQLFSDWLAGEQKSNKLIEPTTSIENSDKKHLQSKDLIDLFIKTEPKIIPSKIEFYSPGVKAKESLKEHDDFVSETLAKIYAKQANIPKAIHVYEKLCLKYPEKSTYFAEQIKKLKDSQTS